MSLSRQSLKIWLDTDLIKVRSFWSCALSGNRYARGFLGAFQRFRAVGRPVRGINYNAWPSVVHTGLAHDTIIVLGNLLCHSTATSSPLARRLLKPLAQSLLPVTTVVGHSR